MSKSVKKAPAPKPAPAPKAAPTANETPATYLARHQKPMLPSEQTLKGMAKARAKADASKKAKVAATKTAADAAVKAVDVEAAKTAAADKAAAEAAAPKVADPIMIIIPGLGDDRPLGAHKRIKHNEPVSVSDEELDWLERNGVAFKRA